MTSRHVLIAHQSTIPHYRVPFYEAVERWRPPAWDFDVAYDAAPDRRSRFFAEPVDHTEFGFPVLPTRTFSVTLAGKRMAIQDFVFRGGRYDLIVVEDALNNLSYPLMRFWRIAGRKLAYWGHGRDTSAVNARLWKRVAENAKLHWARRCDGFFAYTAGVKESLIEHGVEEERIHVLNNTIDIEGERSAYEGVARSRLELRRQAGLEDKRVLLYVGRLDSRKHLGFLGEAVQCLRRQNPAYHLVVIGGGDESLVDELAGHAGPDGITYRGIIVDRTRLARWFARSDAFVFPGDVGLGVVHTLCHSLTPVVVGQRAHNPEFEYLHGGNAVIVQGTPRSEYYAEAIDKLLSDREKWSLLRGNAWPSIEHLTIDNMARAFVDGVNAVLHRPPR